MTTYGNGSCPDPAVLGDYITGTLSPERVQDVTHHVTHCAKCRVDIETICENEQAMEQDPVVVRPDFLKRHGFRVALIAVAAAIVIAAGVVMLRTPRTGQTSDAIATLVAASPKSTRRIEPRLSGGFPWAPFRRIRRSDLPDRSPEELVASGTAGKVLREIGNDRSAQSLHVAGVAYLVADDPETAVTYLTEAASQAAGNARVRSDLSAALYMSADGDDVDAFRRAVDAADRAIRLNPRLAEAYFNRAIALERVGSSRQVVAAWEEYLKRFPDGPWSSEARDRLQGGARP